MIRVESPRDQVKVAKVYEAGQEQIFEYWDELGAVERKTLLDQLDLIDFSELSRLVRSLVLEAGEDEAQLLQEPEPADLIPLPGDSNGNSVPDAEALQAGEEALRNSQVAVFLVAGGQGTRLRFDGPKGLFPVGPRTDKSLFQMFAEKLLAVRRRYKGNLPWLVMTSDVNHETTQAFFQEHELFGFNPGEITFHRQGMLPVVDPRRGKILLRDRGQIVLSPNGHGGAVSVIQEQAESLRNRGIQYLFYLQVDNPMVEMCDPRFIGYHILRGSQFSSKAVAKTDPDEKVGVFCKAGERTMLVEYTELGEQERNARDPDGQLSFRAGNIANHILSLDFLRPPEGEATFEMPFHVARKTTPHLRGGALMESTEPNSIKFESFLFDILRHARNPIVLECSRREFAPVKNYEGTDSPATTRTALMEEWSRWLTAAGYEVPRNGSGEVDPPIEISPLFADREEVLVARLASREEELALEEGLLLE